MRTLLSLGKGVPAWPYREVVLRSLHKSEIANRWDFCFMLASMQGPLSLFGQDPFLCLGRIFGTQEALDGKFAWTSGLL